MNSPSNVLAVPAQQVPVPRSISAEAQAFLGAANRRIAAGGDADADVDRARTMAASLAFLNAAAARFDGITDTIELDTGAKIYHLVPSARDEVAGTVVFIDIHGGGFVRGGGQACALMARARAADFGVELYAVDYRLLPDHPYPAPLDDCLAAYRFVLARHDATSIVVGGASAGGNLAAATLLRARDEGLPLPAGLLLWTPSLDMLGEGDSHATNRYLDVNLYDSGEATRLYAVGQDPRHPHVSPLFGDFAAGWPPTLLSTGTRDLFLSDTVRMHRALRRAGVPADLHLTEAGSHGGFHGSAPEDAEIIAESLRFIRAVGRLR